MAANRIYEKRLSCSQQELLVKTFEPGKLIERLEVAIALISLVLDGACRSYFASWLEQHIQMIEKRYRECLASRTVGKT
jgi:hypothetical protein